MPPSQRQGFLAARLRSPTLDAASKQAQDAATSTTSTPAISSSTSGAVLPSSPFIGAGTAGAGRGVAIGVVASIVAVFLMIMAMALAVHMAAGRGRGRYCRNNKTKQNQGGRGADTMQLRTCRRPQQGGRAHGLPLAVNRAQAPPSTTAAGGWRGALDGKLATCIDAVRGWRA